MNRHRFIISLTLVNKMAQTSEVNFSLLKLCLHLITSYNGNPSTLNHFFIQL